MTRTTRADVPVPPARHAEVISRNAIRRANLGLVLRHIGTVGPRSRVQLAEDLGLPKATVSTLVSELAELGLVRDGDTARLGAVGRPRQSVELDGSGICGVGVEITVDSARVVALDLRGAVLLDRVAGYGGPPEPDAVLDTVARLVTDALAVLKASGRRALGVTVAAPGRIDRDSGTIRYAAVLRWDDVAVVAGLTERLGRTPPPVAIDNDARLGALAEYARSRAEGIHDLVYITGGVGVGAGIVVGGDVMRGALGSAGEIGHLPCGRSDQRCSCGRTGCLETAVGLSAFLGMADPDGVGDVDRRLLALRAMADRGDSRTLAAIDTVARDLASGVSTLVDVLSPRLVVIGGYFTFFADRLVTQISAEVAARAIAVQGDDCEIRASDYAFTGPARGAALQALAALLHDPVAAMGA